MKEGPALFSYRVREKERERKKERSIMDSLGLKKRSTMSFLRFEADDGVGSNS